MRPRRVLLGIPAALRPAAARVAAGLALVLAASSVVPGARAGAVPGPATDARPPRPAAHLPPPPGTTSLMSFRFGGSETAGPGGGGPSADPSLSADGRFVAFASRAPDLVPGDTNNALDVFHLDRRTGTMTRLPLPGGAPVPPGGTAGQPSISADGNVVAFTFTAPFSSTAVAAPPGPAVLAWDRRTGETDIVAPGSNRGASHSPSVSADGRYVAFTSTNPNLMDREFDEGQSDVFRVDRQTGAIVAVSLASDGGWSLGDSKEPSISGDGNVVAFTSDGRNLVAGEPLGTGDQVFVRNLAAETTERISRPPDGGRLAGTASQPSISRDGRWVAFSSDADHLAPGGQPNAPDVYLRDRTSGTTVLVSVAADGTAALGASGFPSISGDGRMVAFASTAPNIVNEPVVGSGATTTRGFAEVYLRDIAAGETVLISVDATGAAAGNSSQSPSVDGEGRFVAFASGLRSLIGAGDANQLADVYLRDLPPVPLLNPPELDLGSRAVGLDAPPAAATLANAGWSALRVTGASVKGAQAAEFPLVFDGCAAAVLRRGEACTMTVGFRPAAAGTRTAVLEVADAFAGSPRTVRLRGAGSLARLELDPPIGPPGVVVVATGSGFPAGAEVRLTWSAGISPRVPAVVADASGAFRVQVLVFHNDRVGPRDLVAASVAPGAFPPIEAEMLVVQPSVSPPGFLVRRFIDVPLSLLIRG